MRSIVSKWYIKAKKFDRLTKEMCIRINVQLAVNQLDNVPLVLCVRCERLCRRIGTVNKKKARIETTAKKNQIE